MRSTKHYGPPDKRVAGGIWRKTKAEAILDQIREKQREIRLLENELARVDPNELVSEMDAAQG